MKDDTTTGYENAMRNRKRSETPYVPLRSMACTLRTRGALEMIAVCSVNAAGFPVPRARVAFSSGRQRTLVGSFGITPVAEAVGPEVVEAVTGVNQARARWALASIEKG